MDSLARVAPRTTFQALWWTSDAASPWLGLPTGAMPSGVRGARHQLKGGKRYRDAFSMNTTGGHAPACASPVTTKP